MIFCCYRAAFVTLIYGYPLRAQSHEHTFSSRVDKPAVRTPRHCERNRQRSEHTSTFRAGSPRAANRAKRLKGDLDGTADQRIVQYAAAHVDTAPFKQQAVVPDLGLMLR